MGGFSTSVPGTGDGAYSTLENVDVYPSRNGGGRPKITAITMFIGRKNMFKKWAKNFRDLVIAKHKVHVLWVLFTKNKRFIDMAVEEFNSIKGEHSKTIVIHKGNMVHKPGDRSGGDWVVRNEGITQGYNFCRSYTDNSDYVFLYEDDTLIPKDTLNRLIPYMENGHIGQVIGRVPHRPNTKDRGKTLAWVISPKHDVCGISSNMKYQVYYVDKQYGGVEEVGAGTFGCTLIRGDLFRSVEMVNKLPGLMGPDVTYGPLLNDRGYKTLLNNWVACQQIHENKRGDIEVYA